MRVSAACVVPGTSMQSMLGILRAELAPLEVSAIGTAPVLASPLDIAVAIDACRAAPPAARVAVTRGRTRREQWIELGDVAVAARDRALALALAESVQGLASGVADESTAPPANGHPAPVATEGTGARDASAAVDRRASAPQPRAPSSGQTEPVAGASQPAGPEPKTQRGPFDDPLSLRVGPLFRYTPRTSTPFFGAGAGIGWRRLAFGLRGLAARDTVPLGSAWEAGILATAAADWLLLGSHAAVRSGVELGAALAKGKPVQPAVGRLAASPHWGVTTSLRLVSPLDPKWDLEALVGGGYASSLTARVDGRDFMSLGGWFVQAALGARWSPWGHSSHSPE